MTIRGGTACVIGGHGALGAAVVAELRAAGWTVHRAGRRAAENGDRHLDLDRPETIGPALDGVDLAISAVARPELSAERWVLEHGGLLVNCSHAPGAAAAELSAEGRPAGTVLLNAGLVPGIANLAAAGLLDRHPEADRIEVAFTVLTKATAGRAGGEFVHRSLTTRSHHRVVALAMPEPFGELDCIEVAEGQDTGLSGVAGAREAGLYLGFADRLPRLALHGLNALRLMRALPRAAFSVDRSNGHGPSEEPAAVRVGACLDGCELGSTTIECEGDYRITAAAARGFAELLDGVGPGCFNPEDLFGLGDLTAALAGSGLQVASSS